MILFIADCQGGGQQKARGEQARAFCLTFQPGGATEKPETKKRKTEALRLIAG
jgi:hypothetical protein